MNKDGKQNSKGGIGYVGKKEKKAFLIMYNPGLSFYSIYLFFVVFARLILDTRDEL